MSNNIDNLNALMESDEFLHDLIEANNRLRLAIASNTPILVGDILTTLEVTVRFLESMAESSRLVMGALATQENIQESMHDALKTLGVPDGQIR